MESKEPALLTLSRVSFPLEMEPAGRAAAAPGPGKRLGFVIKRGFDILVALLGLILLAPVFGLVAWLIVHESPGPAFYRGERLGRGGKVFKILKFRTMYARPDSYSGPRVTAKDDPRITPLGHWLRATKLNEFPQLWNVLIGEMSLVGPRPEDPEIGRSWSEEVRQEVLSVRPGITSPASVLYRDEETMLRTKHLLEQYLGSIQPSKLRLDQLYVRYRSFWLDLDVLMWTLLVMLPNLGSYKPPEASLFLGPVTRLFSRYVNWFTIDTLTTLFAMAITGVFWRSLGPLDVGLPKASAIAVGFAFLFSLTGALLGVNRIVWSQANARDAGDLIMPTLLATTLALLANRFLGEGLLLKPQLIIMASGLAFLGFIMVRYRERLVSSAFTRLIPLSRGTKMVQERVLIVGGGDAGQFMTWIMNNHRDAQAFRVIGFVDDNLYKQGARIRGTNVLGRREDIPRLVAQHDIGIVIFAIHNITPAERKSLLEICASTPARVVMMPDILGQLKAVMNGNGHRANQTAVPEAVEGMLSKQQVQDWFEELETLAQMGDVPTLAGRLQEIRSQMQTSQEL